MGPVVTHRPQEVLLREQVVPHPLQEVHVENKVFKAPGRPRDHQGSRRRPHCRSPALGTASRTSALRSRRLHL
eukprot:5289123-Heterocapsa_arctica.AAC.1